MIRPFAVPLLAVTEPASNSYPLNSPLKNPTQCFDRLSMSGRGLFSKRTNPLTLSSSKGPIALSPSTALRMYLSKGVLTFSTGY